MSSQVEGSCEKARSQKFFNCGCGWSLRQGARANLEKSRGKMFDGFEKRSTTPGACEPPEGGTPAGRPVPEEAELQQRWADLMAILATLAVLGEFRRNSD